MQRSFDKSEMFSLSFLKILLKFYFTSMGVLAVCMSVLYYVHAWFRKKPKDRFGSHETVDKDSYELPYWC